MTDHLHPVLDDAAIARMTSLALAHVGDAVYEILVRPHLACGGTQTANNLHSRTYVTHTHLTPPSNLSM